MVLRGVVGGLGNLPGLVIRCLQDVVPSVSVFEGLGQVGGLVVVVE